jgi:signal transduction histidine kinase
MATLVTDTALQRLLDAGRAVASDLELDVLLKRLTSIASDVTSARHAEIDERPGAASSEHGGIDVPIAVEGRPWGRLRLREKADGQQFDDADEQAATALAEWAAIAVANARRRRRLETTIDIARALGGETDLQRILDLIVHRGLELFEARGVLILLREPGGLRVAAVAGEAPPRFDGAPLRCGPDRVVDALGLAGHDGTVVPLVFRGRTLGMLVVLAGAARCEPHTLLSSFASSAATAVASARSVEERRLRDAMHAAEEERRRWARELHDTTLQGLGGLRILITAGSRTDDPERLRPILRRAMTRLEHEIAGLRELVRELRPAALDELGLAAAIEGLAARTASRERIAVTADVQLARPRLDPDLETAIYRILQEATANAVRHADAHHVDLSLTESDDAVHVRVTDDGRGFDPGARADGYGLLGMRERVALLHGELEIVSSDDGTVITAALPAELGAAASTRTPGR